MSPVQLCVFGSEALVRLARGLVEDAQVASLECGRTSFADLLYRCSLGSADA
jgi:hypothetical protein